MAENTSHIGWQDFFFVFIGLRELGGRDGLTGAAAVDRQIAMG